MSQVFFCVEKPTSDNLAEEQRWKSCITNMHILAERNPSITLLGDCVLLISLNNDLNALAGVIGDIHGLSYKYKLIEDKIDFILVSGSSL